MNTFVNETVNFKVACEATKIFPSSHNIPSKLLSSVYWFRFCFFLVNPNDMVVYPLLKFDTLEQRSKL